MPKMHGLIIKCLLKLNKIKNLEISDDLKSNLEIDSQDLTDKYIKKVDEMLSVKEKDILTL